MNIVHVTRQFHPGHGGLENVVDNLARLQAAKGHQVRVVTLNKLFGRSETLPSAETREDVKIVRIRFFGSQRYPIAPSVLQHLWDADLVHVHAIDFFFDFLAITKLIHRKTLIVSTHGGFFHTEFASHLKRLYFLTVTRLSLRSYAFVAASSEQDRELFSPIRRRGIATVANGVDCDKFAGLSRTHLSKQMIYFGRLAPNKNLDALMLLLQVLRGRDPAWRLVIAGRPMGVSVDYLMGAAKIASVADAVTIIDTPTDVLLRNAIGTSSVFVSPSHYEGFGIAAIEAISAGLMPVLSDIKAHRDTVRTAGAGILVDFSRPSEVADTILAHHGRWNVNGEAADMLIRRLAFFSWASVAERFEDIYTRVTGRKERNIVGARVRVENRGTVISMIDDAVANRTPLRLAFVNAHLANKLARSVDLRNSLEGFCLLNDGLGLDLASIALYGQQFPENLNGTDLVPTLLCQSKRKLRIYLLGGSEEVVCSAAKLYAGQWPQHNVVGHHNGFFSEEEEKSVADCVRATNPDVVLVAMGNPRQEIWIARHIPSVCPVGLAVGALFDFQVGRVQRAPLLIRTARLEWLYRMCLEPRRLWRRYVFGNAMFLGRVVTQAARGERA